MITYIDSKNKQDYTVLFEKASAKLGLIPIVKEVLNEQGEIQYEYWKRVQNNEEWTEVLCEPSELDADHNLIINGEVSKGISSLNEYFQHIRELAEFAIGNGRKGSDPYLLRLPLDEPYFEINANTRVISVPSQLKQIGVVGDKYAEVVFFKIDRYFDAVDLDTRQIYIEWENAAGKKGVSRDFLRDTQSEKDKIIFAWIIDDELTKQAGTIRFAVRFVEWNYDANSDEDSAVAGTQLAYSFSSIPAQINVVDSLHYDLFENSEQAEMIGTNGQAQTILFYLENSTPDSADETAPESAGLPIFIRNLTGDLVEEGLYEADLESGQLELSVEAYSPDSGSLSYMFGRKAQLDEGTTGIGANIKFVKTILEQGHDFTNDNKVYYIKKANDTYAIISHSELEDELEVNDDVEVYEKIASIIVNQPGYYYANVRNAVSGKKTSVASSNMLYVPYASEPTVVTSMPQKFVIGEKTYSIDYDETINQSAVPGAFQGNARITVSEAGPTSITLGVDPIGPKFTATKSSGLTYSWYKADNAEMNNATAINNVGPTLTVTEPGYYAVAVSNSYNNSEAELDKMVAGIICVTDMPVIEDDDVLFADWSNIIAAGNLSTEIEIAQPEVCGTVTYEWHMVTGDSGDSDEVANGYMQDATGVVTFTNGVGTVPFKPLQSGYYYFILKNELNGAFALWNSNKVATIVVTGGTSIPPVEEPTEPEDNSGE